MSTFEPVSINVATQPTNPLAYIPYCGAQAGELLTDPELHYNIDEQSLVIPLLTADPTDNPPANTVMIYAVLSGGNYSIRLKTSGGAVKTTGTLS